MSSLTVYKRRSWGTELVTCPRSQLVSHTSAFYQSVSNPGVELCPLPPPRKDVIWWEEQWPGRQEALKQVQVVPLSWFCHYQ